MQILLLFFFWYSSFRTISVFRVEKLSFIQTLRRQMVLSHRFTNKTNYKTEQSIMCSYVKSIAK